MTPCERRANEPSTMKTEASFVQCLHCLTYYIPALSKGECPHNSRSESALLKDLREKGKPYKVEPWTATEVA